LTCFKGSQYFHSNIARLSSDVLSHCPCFATTT